MFIPSKPSGYYIHLKVYSQTSKLYPRSLFTCIEWISKQTKITSIYSITLMENIKCNTTPLIIIIIIIHPLGLVWAGTRAQAGDRFGSGTLHPGQVLRSSLPLLSPGLDFPTFAARCLHVRKDARDPSSERWNYGRERLSGNFAYMASLFTPLGIFHMP